MRQRAAHLSRFVERESMLIVIVGAYTCGLLARLPDQLRQDGWLTLVAGRFVAHAGDRDYDSTARFYFLDVR